MRPAEIIEMMAKAGFEAPPVHYARLVGMRHDMLGAGLSSGANQNATYQRFHKIGYGKWRSPRLCYLNELLNAAGSGLPANTLTIKSSIVTSTRLVPIYFGGARTLTLAPGAVALSDPGSVVLSAPGFWERTTVSVDTLGKKWPVMDLPTVPDLSEGYIAGDHCDDAAPAFGTAQPFGTVGVIAVPDCVAPSVAIIGSSSGWGQGDTAAAPDYAFGYIARGLTRLGVPYLRMSYPGDTLAVFLADWDARRKALLAAQPTHVIFQLGTNDVSAGTAEATIRANYLAALDRLDGLGIRVVATTWWPPTTNNNGDGWTTAAGQTPNAFAGVYASMNGWMKTIPHPAIVKVIDPASLVCDPANPAKFRTDLGPITPDGTHLNALGQNTAQACVALG